jgi:hypothetical protein
MGLAGWLALGGLMINETRAKETTMTTKEMSLWQAIEALTQQIPFTKAKVERVLSTVLTETDNTGNDVFQFYESPSLGLKDGVAITNVDLRIKRRGVHPGFMVLEIGGTCVTLKEARVHYSDLVITGSPSGRSLDDATSHSSMQSWGRLSFGFSERNPDCLAYIAFDPKKPG